MMLRPSQVRDNIDLKEFENNSKKKLTKRDKAFFPGLMKKEWVKVNKHRKEEIELMKKSGNKYQINSFLHVKGGFVNFLEKQLRKIEQKELGYEKVAL